MHKDPLVNPFPTQTDPADFPDKKGWCRRCSPARYPSSPRDDTAHNVHKRRKNPAIWDRPSVDQRAAPPGKVPWATRKAMRFHPAARNRPGIAAVKQRLCPTMVAVPMKFASQSSRKRFVMGFPTPPAEPPELPPENDE